MSRGECICRRALWALAYRAGAGRSPPVQADELDKAGIQDGGIILDSDGRREDSGYKVEQWMGHRKVMWVVA